MSWQKRLRLGVALFGTAVALVVYAAMGERETAVPGERPSRFDPKAIVESASTAFRQFQEARQDYVIESERQLTYEGGATKFVGIKVTVRGRAGRDFVVSGREAQAREGQRDLEIIGDVRLEASDGFVLTTDRATFSDADGTVRAPGALSFRKGTMAGSGVGMTYDQSHDVLTIVDSARVTVSDSTGAVVDDLTAQSATFAREEDYLALHGNIHVLRSGQVLDADSGVARLTPDDELITFIELRGNARVAGGSVFDALSARDIDLDYSPDGLLLERVVLTGNGAIDMKGTDGATGRRFRGEQLDITLAADGNVTSATGRGGVRLDLPAAPGLPQRSITSRELDSTGEEGRGLTSARFTSDVEFREAAIGTTAARSAFSDGLRVALASDAVTAAVFTGRVRFAEQGLQASGAQASYDPVKGALQLTGRDAGGGPRVADDQITVEAGAIDLTLEGRRMSAKGNVRTTMRRPATGGSNRLPGLLQQNEPVNLSADALEYEGAASKAAYTGNAALLQGETAIRGNAITLDQSTGDLLVTGTPTAHARSTLRLDAGTMIGRAVTIRYEDAARKITYDSPLSAMTSQVSDPPRDLRAERIEVLLAASGSTADRLEAYSNVNARIDATRTATSTRLTYFASDERYELTGVPTMPVKLVENCRETTGSKVTFFKTSDRIVVDGRDETRTASRQSAGCTPASPR